MRVCGFRVSIPHRYAKNAHRVQNRIRSPSVSILIGTLKTVFITGGAIQMISFQFLIGTLKTPVHWVHP